MHAIAVQPSAIPRYLLDGEPVTLRELLAVNDFDADVIVQIRSLPPGQRLAIAGSPLTRAPGEVA